MSLRSDISSYVAKKLNDHLCDVLDRLNKETKKHLDEGRKRTQGIYYAPPLTSCKHTSDCVKKINQ